ncbi:MAG: hypothetical protein J0L78_14205 [Planctomycetes bacterium]|nr:hypothetical protein [Planctomycetota bacterium]
MVPSPAFCTECGYTLAPASPDSLCTECGTLPLSESDKRHQAALASFGLFSIALATIATGAMGQYRYRFESFDGSVPRYVAWLALACATLIASVVITPGSARRLTRRIVFFSALLFAIKVAPLTPLPRWGTPLHPLFRFDLLGSLFEWWEVIAIPATFACAIYTVSCAARLFGPRPLARIGVKSALAIAAFLLFISLSEQFLEPYLSRLDAAIANALAQTGGPSASQSVTRPMSFPLALRHSLEWLRELSWIFCGSWLIASAFCCWTQAKLRAR